MTNAQVGLSHSSTDIYEGPGSAEVIGFVTDANRGMEQRNGTHRKKKKMRGCLVSVKTNHQLL